LRSEELAGGGTTQWGESNRGRANVFDGFGHQSKFKALGIEGVPGFVVKGTVLFSGAAESQVIAGTLGQWVSSAFLSR
jgi:hypothetical protein